MPDTLIDCSLNRPEGFTEAWVCDREDDTWLDYLDSFGLKAALLDAIAEAAADRIGIFERMEVFAANRGVGAGRALRDETLSALKEAGAEVTMLFADLEAGNAFDLVAWYERAGFVRIDRDVTDPFMMMGPADLVNEARSINGMPQLEETPAP